MSGTNKLQDFRKRLLGGTSMAAILAVGVAVGSAGPAMATDITSQNAGTATTQADDTTMTFGTDGAYGFILSDTNNTITGTTVTQDGTLYITDTGNSADVLDFASTVAITSGKTFTIELAKTAAGALGDEVSLQFSAAVTAAGGALAINSTDNSARGDGNLVDFESTVTLGTLTIKSGDGGVGALGGKISLVDISDTSVITTLTLKAGSGAAGSVQPGGELTITDVNGAISGTTYMVSGGDGAVSTFGGTGGAGGATVVTTINGAISSATLTFQGGDGANGTASNSGRKGGAGGTLDMNHLIDGAITSTTVNLLGGAGGDGTEDGTDSADGGAGGALVNANTFTSTIQSALNITGGAAGAAGAGATGAGGDAGLGGSVGGGGLTFTGLVTGVVTVKGGAGSAGATSTLGVGGAGAVGGAVTVLDFIAGVTGALGATGGAGGAGSSATTSVAGAIGAVGGAVVLTDINAQTGDLTLIGGAAGAGGAGGTSGAGAAGADGGAVTITNISATMVGDITMTGKAGSSGGTAGSGVVGGAGAGGGAVAITNIKSYAGSADTGGAINMTAGDGGAAGASATGYNGGAAGAGGNVVINDIDGTPDISTFAMTAGAGGDGSAAATTQAGVAGGTAGTATAGMTGGATTEITTLTLTGGDGGDAGAAGTSAVGGVGVIGGATVLTIDNVRLTAQGNTGSVTITITGGAGGDGGDGGSDSGTGGTGVAGGAATLDLGGTTSIAAITLDDGTAGTAGSTDGGAGGDAGAGGVATLAFTATHTLTGSISAAADDEGIVTIATGGLTVTGSIGSSSKDIDQVTVSIAAGLTITGNLYAKDVVLDVDGAQLSFTGTSEQIVSAAISAGSGGAEDITMGNSAVVTFNAAIGTNSGGSANALVAITTSDSSTVKFNSTVKAATLTLDAAGTATFEDAVTLTGALLMGNTSVITLGKGIVAGETVFTTVSGGTTQVTVAATVNMPNTFTSGAITLVNNDGNTGTGDAAKLTVNSNVLATYSAAVGDDATELDITATKKSSSSIASALSITTQEATALDNANTAVASGDTTAYAAMNTVLGSGGTVAAKAAEQVSVQADTMGAGTAAAVAAGGQVLGAASTRLASLRSGEQYASTEGTGFATGGERLSKTAWFKPFGNWIRQGTRNNIKGYDADTYGAAAGIDGEYAKNVRLGVSFAYSQTDVDGKGTGQSQTDVKSYQGMVYGDYTAKMYYVEGMIAYARNESDTSRILNFGGLNRTVIGDFKSNQYMGKVGAGVPNNIKGAAFITPTAGLSWTHVSGDSYTETGGGGFNQIVNPEDVDVIVGSVGVKIHTKIKSGGGSVVPELRGGLNYDFVGDEAAASATYTGGGAAFTVTGAEVAQLGGSAGLGLTYIQGAISVAANYDAEIKEDFVSHSGTFEARFKF